MEKLAVILLLAFAFGAGAASFPYTKLYHLRIDCGVNDDGNGALINTINNDSWFRDGGLFTDSGKAEKLPSGATAAVPEFLATLRTFPGGENQDPICYPLPLATTHSFLFRGGFYYANYDGKSQPPVFDLQLAGKTLAAVDPSGGAPTFVEVVYWPRNDNITVCLVGRKDGGRPFISSLEATALDGMSYNQTPMYRKMTQGTAYRLVSRLNFGGDNQVVEPWSMWANSCEETQNRYWVPQRMDYYSQLTFERSTACTGRIYENVPPDSVITTAVTPAPTAPSQSIYVPVEFPSTDNTTATTAMTVYVVLYFYQGLNSAEVREPMRIMDIYIDGWLMGSVGLEEHDAGEVVTLYPVTVSGGTMNLTISPGEKTALPPLLNGMEVFLAMEMGHEVFSYGFRVSCWIVGRIVLQVLLIIGVLFY
ncbi:receptor-like protein kinase At5g59670 [Andrographis paniculata]|uniref:receptor-like protein kinase At5g59670 n=1 Tax=Andrographis paniculata TaxID=175694 RepID=UPI0021E94B60|nr:receptor-like protein kinase At5g59670 [Andrographis paniculata]